MNGGDNVAKPAGGQRPEKTESLNDIGFRLVLIPAFGIAIPFLTGMIDPIRFTHWSLKLAYLYTIGLSFVVWHGNRYLLFSLRSYFDWFNKPIRKIIALLIAVTFFTIPMSALMLIGWYQIFNNGVIVWQVVNVSTLAIMICVLFITHVYETVFLVKDTESEIVRNEQLERSKAEAELRALKNQIDPHFLFNSLNTMSQLIDEYPRKAKHFNEQLADVYRYILQNRSSNLVLVREEMHFLEDYFSLQKIRYEEAVELTIDIPDEIFQTYMVPPISLQALVENAFKHNEFSKRDPLEITVRFEDAMIVVRNKLRKRSHHHDHTQTGLANIGERYKLIMGRTITVREKGGEFCVYLPVLSIR